VSEDDQKVRELFREAAKKEGKSLRQWCRDNGIVYDTLIGREIISDTPLSAIHDHDGTYFGVCPACAKD
jgi:hypothetical protein